MLRYFGLAMVASIMAITATSCLAGGPTGAPPATDPDPNPKPIVDPGPIYNKPTNVPGKINSWISRAPGEANGVQIVSSAIAITLLEPDINDTQKTIRGTLLQYENDLITTPNGGGDELRRIPLTVCPTAGGADQVVQYIPIKLLKNSSKRYESYDILYEARSGYPTISNAPTPLVLGWISFKPGKKDRSQSIIRIRMKKDVIKKPGTVSPDPCDGPPTDDIGEEEQVLSSRIDVPLAALPSAQSVDVNP